MHIRSTVSIVESLARTNLRHVFIRLLNTSPKYSNYFSIPVACRHSLALSWPVVREKTCSPFTRIRFVHSYLSRLQSNTCRRLLVPPSASILRRFWWLSRSFSTFDSTLPVCIFDTTRRLLYSIGTVPLQVSSRRVLDEFGWMHLICNTRSDLFLQMRIESTHWREMGQNRNNTRREGFDAWVVALSRL